LIRRNFNIKNLVRELAENKVSVLELIREALSNAVDHSAHTVWITTRTESARKKVSVILADDGEGMDDARLAAFWGVGDTSKVNAQRSIGYKGHGTKLFFNCRRLQVVTRTEPSGDWRLTELDRPAEYDREEISEVVLPGDHRLARVLDETGLVDGKGTVIYIEELDFEDQQDLLSREKLESYCDWFTVIGDVRSGLYDERVAFHKAIVDRTNGFESLRRNDRILAPLTVKLRVNGELAYYPLGQSPGSRFFDAWQEDLEAHAERPDLLAYGHRFANAFAGGGHGTRLRDDRSALRMTGPADWALNNGIAIVARLEGHRRQLDTYKEASWQGHPGIYGFEQRFGLWLCRDFIPVTQRNDLLHSALDRAFATEAGYYGFNNLRNWKVFVNRQDFRLTANRNEISRQESVESQIVDALAEVLARARKQKTFRDWVSRLRSARHEKRKDKETAQMERRLREIEVWIQQSPKSDAIDPSEVEGLEELGEDYSLEMKTPTSEQELFYVYGLLSGRYVMPLHIIEYNASEGIDAIGQLRAPRLVPDGGPHVRVELKLEVSANNPIHHFFDAIDIILCWKVGKGGTIYEESSAGAGTLRRRENPVLDPPLDTYEIDPGEGGRVIPVIELSALFPDAAGKKTKRGFTRRTKAASRSSRRSRR